jgi:hypothetical protein
VSTGRPVVASGEPPRWIRTSPRRQSAASRMQATQDSRML